MEMSRFRWGMNELYAYYGRKPLTDAQERVYWEAVCRYSDRAWTETVTNLMRCTKPLAGNFPSPQELRTTCQNMQDSREGPTGEEVQEHYCSECGGRGFLESYAADDPMQYTSVVRCGHCENWRRRFGPTLPIRTRRQLEARGRILTRGGYRREDWEEWLELGWRDLTPPTDGTGPLTRILETIGA